jgi:hypothetical protein
VLSHVTLNPLFGLSGALLNGGYDCLSGRARTRVLEGVNPYLFNGQSIALNVRQLFRKRALECHCAVKAAMEGRVFYVNFLWDVTPQPEYYPFSDQPILANLGFLASHDPVALDRTTFDLIKAHTPDPGIVSETAFTEIIADAETMGLGKSGNHPNRLS